MNNPLTTAEAWEDELMDTKKYPTAISCTRAIQRNAIEATLEVVTTELQAIFGNNDLDFAITALLPQIMKIPEQTNEEKVFSNFIQKVGDIVNGK